MNCSINSASNFSGLQAGMSPISLVQLAGSVRKFNLNRPFILPILLGLKVITQELAHTLRYALACCAVVCSGVQKMIFLTLYPSGYMRR